MGQPCEISKQSSHLGHSYRWVVREVYRLKFRADGEVERRNWLRASFSSWVVAVPGNCILRQVEKEQIVYVCFSEDSREVRWGLLVQ